MLATTAAPAVETIGSWELSYSVDAMTDARVPVARIRTPAGQLRVTCDKAGPGSVWLAFDSEGFFGDGRATFDRPVTWRIDDQAPRSNGKWAYGDTSVMLMKDDGSVLAQLVHAKRFTIRGMTYRYQELTGTFDVTGADVVIPRIFAECRDQLSGINLR